MAILITASYETPSVLTNEMCIRDRVNAERYITQELKEYEEKILGAEDKILVLETRLYTELRCV